MDEFIPFPKIPRLNREIVVTEKIDGTNAQVIVEEDGTVHAGSRKRFIAPGKATDNFGFAGWVEEHADELRHLGVGNHYGEWWGKGIQKHPLDRRVFSLFNTERWSDPETRPSCCDVVPTLYTGPFSVAAIEDCVESLRRTSFAAFRYGCEAKAEGIIVFHTHARSYFKVTLENDHCPKGAVA